MLKSNLPEGVPIGYCVRYKATTSQFEALRLKEVGRNKLLGIELGNTENGGTLQRVLASHRYPPHIDIDTGGIVNATVTRWNRGSYDDFNLEPSRSQDPYTLLVIETGNDQLPGPEKAEEDGVCIKLNGNPLFLAWGRRGNRHGAALESIVRLGLDRKDSIVIASQGKPDDLTVMEYISVKEEGPDGYEGPEIQHTNLVDYLERKRAGKQNYSIQQEIDLIHTNLDNARRSLRNGTFQLSVFTPKR